jgi:hypothetical protein
MFHKRNIREGYFIKTYTNTSVYIFKFRESQLPEREWLKDYRVLKVLEAHINSCIGSFWFPFNLFGLMMITLIGTCLVIRVHPGLTMSVVSGSTAVMMLVFQYILTYFASNSTFFSEDALKRQKENCTTRLVTKELRSCRSFGMKSGSFRIIDRDAMLIVMMANVNYTISVLLTL